MNDSLPRASISFIDLAAQRRRLGSRIDEAILRVIDHGAYILGPEIATLESALREFTGAKNVISCANGTDALMLVLLANGVRAGDAVFCPSFTFAATAEVIALVGATPVFVDVHLDTFNLDAQSLEAGIHDARRIGLRPVGVIPVDLFGQMADYDVVIPVANEHGLWVLCDAAQAFGATYKGRLAGTMGNATTTSFFPAKPLGCYGDGGAIFTNDFELATVLRSLRVHGQGSDKYDNVRLGVNGRLDTIQAAVLLEKLKIFSDELNERERIAGRYRDGLHEIATTPQVLEGCRSVWAQYTIRVDRTRRSDLVTRLKKRGIPTAIYYPKPVHKQTAYRQFPVAGGALTNSETLAEEVLSLPMHPYLEHSVQDFIIDAIRAAFV